MKSRPTSVAASAAFRPALRLATLPVVLLGATALAQDGAVHPRVAADIARMQEAYLIGPDDASRLGCRIGWQSTVPLPAGHGLQLVFGSSEGVAALNSRNEVTFLRAATGDRAWSTSGAETIDRVFAIDILGPLEGAPGLRVAVLTESSVYVLDGENGATLRRASVPAIPSSPPVAVDGSVVYGSRTGEVIWLQTATGYVLKRARVDRPLPADELYRPGEPVRGSAVRSQPAVAEGTAVATTAAGTVAAYDARSGKLFWTRELLDGVSCSASILGGTAFVASEDQYLYAFDLGSGATLWKYFTQARLNTSPFAAGEMVFQDIPGEGFVAFAADGGGSPGGKVLWKKSDLRGRPIGTALRGKTACLVLWCPDGRRVTLLEMATGEEIDSIDLPKVTHIEKDGIENGGFLAWSVDGRVEYLSPRTIGAPSSSGEGAEEAGSARE
jgi:hypothetical protein